MARKEHVDKVSRLLGASRVVPLGRVDHTPMGLAALTERVRKSRSTGARGTGDPGLRHRGTGMIGSTCEYCEGVIQERRVREDHWRGDSLVIIEDVPVGVCNKCRERYYSAVVLRKMDRVVAQRSKIKRTIRVPVVTFDSTA